MTNRRSAQARAASVSRTLRTGGLNPLGSGTSRMREGIRVKASLSYTLVSVDVDSSRQAERLIQDCIAILTNSGYRADRAGGDESGESFLLHVETV